MIGADVSDAAGKFPSIDETVSVYVKILEEQMKNAHTCLGE